MAAKLVLIWEPFARTFHRRVVGPDLSKRDMKLRLSIPVIKRVAVALWIKLCLEKVVNDTWNEKYNALFYLTDCLPVICHDGTKCFVENVTITRSAHLRKWNTTPPQVDISVILTLVTTCNHAWSQGNFNFHVGQISFVFCSIYSSISWHLHPENVYLGEVTLLPR